MAPNKLMPPLEIGFERFEENEFDTATILEQRNSKSNNAIDTVSVYITYIMKNISTINNGEYYTIS